MFTTTNVAATTASAGGGGPVAVVPATFQLTSTPATGSSSSSASSTTTTAWRLTPTPSTNLIKQPSMVSIVNGNMNLLSTTGVPISSTGVTMPTIGNKIYIATTSNSPQHNPISTGNLILQTPQTVRIIQSPLHTSLSAPTLTVLNNRTPTIINNGRPIVQASISSISNNSKPGICIETAPLGRLAPITIQQQQQQQQLQLHLQQRLQQQMNTNNCLVQPTRSLTPPISTTNHKTADEQDNTSNSCTVSNDNDSVMNTSQDQEIEIIVNNVVCTFALCCSLNLRKIAMEAANVIYKREHSMVMMKMRNPNCSANVWSSGKVTVTGSTSEDDAQRGARRIARSLQRLGFKVKFRHYRVVNCLASCSMPWPIDIVKLSRLYPECVSYEPEIHPGATVRLPGKAVLKVFTTGSITITAPRVERLNTAINEFYPQLYECRNQRHC